MPSSFESRLERYGAIADKLLSLAGDSSGLAKKQNKSFIVLERKLVKSDRNKNAISLKREGVSFMLPNLTEAAEQAKLLDFSVKPDQDFPQRLIFPDLELSKVTSFSDFFSNLTKQAALHSEYLQSAVKHEKS